MLGDGLASDKRWDYLGRAVCHALEDSARSVSRRLVEAVVRGASQNSLAYDTGSCVCQTSGAKIVQCCCIIEYVHHVSVLELGPSRELLVAGKRRAR